MTKNKRTVVYIDERTHRKVRVLAAEEGVTASEVYRQAVELYLEQRGEHEKEER